jgi:uncharacterized protein YjiK
MDRGRAAMVMAVCALAALAGSVPAGQADKVKKADKRKKAPPGSMPVAGVREPSGIAWHAGLSRFFVVGDDGTLAELDAEGRVQGTVVTVGGNLEDVTAHGPSGLLVLLSEAAGELIVWDPRARRETGRARLDTEALLGRRPTDPGQGFEGLYFRPSGGGEAGGVFYLVHQRGPSAVLAIRFDPIRPPATIGADAVAFRWPEIGASDLTAITALDEGTMAVIAEASDRLLLFDPRGVPRGEAALPGLQQEGLCVDGRGALWVADDRGGVTRLGSAGALVRSGATGGSPAGRTNRSR